MDKVISYNGKNYFYKKSEYKNEAGESIIEENLFNESGAALPERESILIHFYATGRTPLDVPFITSKMDENNFKRLDLLISQLPFEKKRNVIFHATRQIRRKIKVLESYAPEMMRKKYYPEMPEGDTLLYFKDKLAYYEMLFDSNEKGSDLPEKVWKKLHQNLIQDYISDVSLKDFNEVMNYKRLPNGKGKIKWIGEKTEAMHFKEHYGFPSLKIFNQCFIPSDGKKFIKSNRSRTTLKKSFTDLLVNE
jgi:hypothetical protein